MKNVKVYGTLACPFCVKVKQFLKDQNVAFEDIDVAQDEARLQEIVEKTGQMGVPVIEIDGEIIIGFDRGKIVQALGLAD
ncbi:MAG: glutaredoxin domain-containing protein [Candidatus Omnitrophota bacterium]|nr:glutathione S-transferase N-terminal domain-containing protein [Candidatus Omnitrophota bacterium]MBU1894289.1 glutathione S-transferase N-terminal domain-containing protein [Candidatus Omnitrophota bacterium]